MGLTEPTPEQPTSAHPARTQKTTGFMAALLSCRANHARTCLSSLYTQPKLPARANYARPFFLNFAEKTAMLCAEFN
jgi:hypothetical protein